MEIGWAGLRLFSYAQPSWVCTIERLVVTPVHVLALAQVGLQYHPQRLPCHDMTNIKITVITENTAHAWPCFNAQLNIKVSLFYGTAWNINPFAAISPLLPNVSYLSHTIYRFFQITYTAQWLNNRSQYRYTLCQRDPASSAILSEFQSTLSTWL